MLLGNIRCQSVVARREEARWRDGIVREWTQLIRYVEPTVDTTATQKIYRGQIVQHSQGFGQNRAAILEVSNGREKGTEIGE